MSEPTYIYEVSLHYHYIHARPMVETGCPGAYYIPRGDTHAVQCYDSEHFRYFRDFNEARTFLMGHIGEVSDALKRELDALQDTIGRVFMMEESDTHPKTP